MVKSFYARRTMKKKKKTLIHTFSCVRFHTITLWPLLIKFFTIPLPMMPSPRKPNFRFDGRIFFSLRVFDIVSRSKGGVTCRKRWKNVTGTIFVQTIFEIFKKKYIYKKLEHFLYNDKYFSYTHTIQLA